MNDSDLEFKITVKPVPGNWQSPVIARLRRFLKSALRGYGLRATAITVRPVEPPLTISGSNSAPGEPKETIE